MHPYASAQLLHFKRANQREMVGGNQGGTRAVHAEAGETKGMIVVEVVKMQDRKNSRVGVWISEQSVGAGRFEYFSHEA
jgi:hypothetical protein